jgi:hypothetical protein
MYLYFQPHGGFNDIMCRLADVLDYCSLSNRTLMINMYNQVYRINFSDYFNLENYNIVGNKNDILKIVNDAPDIYPSYIDKKKLIKIINGEHGFTYTKTGYTYEDKHLSLSLGILGRQENIVVYACCGGGNGYTLFKQLTFCPDIKNICKERYNLLTKPYLGIHVRNTDYQSNYKKLYEDNKVLIHKFNCIYLATDNIDVFTFFKSTNLNIFNFTTFNNNKYKNLHIDSEIDPHTKITDVMSDIYIISLCDKLLSNSCGGFNQLLRTCNTNKDDIINQFKK